MTLGKRILKISGILNIVFFGFFALLMGFLVMVMIFGHLTIGLFVPITNNNLLRFFIWFLGASYGLFLGVLGVKKCNDLKAAKLLQILAVVFIVGVVANALLPFLDFNLPTSYFWILRAVEITLSILFFIGASMNRIAYRKLIHTK